jgi:hypothetical protein
MTDAPEHIDVVHQGPSVVEIDAESSSRPSRRPGSSADAINDHG